MKQKELMKEFYYMDLLEALADCWDQFALESNNKFQDNGGLSTLENVEKILKEHELLLDGNRIDWNKLGRYLFESMNREP